MDGTLDKTLQKFHDDYTNLTGSLTGVLASIDEEREALRRERLHLDQQRKAFQEEQRKVAQVAGLGFAPQQKNEPYFCMFCLVARWHQFEQSLKILEK
jgi:hypothetical protein